MKVPSLKSQIRNGTLLILLLLLLISAYALPRVYQLGGAIKQTLYRNYLTIECAQRMQAALRDLQLAERSQQAKQAVPAARTEFRKWMRIEDNNFTEQGEPELANDIESHAEKLFDAILTGQEGTRHDAEFGYLYQRLDGLISMNKDAMFRADSRAARLGRALTFQLAIGLAIMLLIGGVLAWGLGWQIARPLTELAERLRGVGQRRSQMRLGEQKLAELQSVAYEFNQMAERLEQFEKLNVERLVYEKRKPEAIIESLEDGVVLIDSEGIVAHINEIAAIIMGVEPRDALGSPFDDLSSNHPHYLRVRDALRNYRKNDPSAQQIEVQLHVRGRDHTYVLKPIPLRGGDDTLFGTILILQDVTYLRDQDLARANLVATLSHELRTPLTSLSLSAELLRREAGKLDPKQRELSQAILDECDRMKQLSDNLLNLARGDLGAIAVRRERIDLREIIGDVLKRFDLQARERQIEIIPHLESIPEVMGDSIKLSWVVSNLVGNALRYTPSGGRIDVTARPENNRVHFEVADSGPGIPPEIRDHIFERFAQYGPNGVEKGAAGLGLAIAKDIVAAHSGRIFVESEKDAGSRFVVELPSGDAA